MRLTLLLLSCCILACSERDSSSTVPTITIGTTLNADEQFLSPVWDVSAQQLVSLPLASFDGGARLCHSHTAPRPGARTLRAARRARVGDGASPLQCPGSQVGELRTRRGMREVVDKDRVNRFMQAGGSRRAFREEIKRRTTEQGN